MSHTFTLPEPLFHEIEALRGNLGFEDTSTAIRHLLKEAVDRERKRLVIRSYRNGEKTIRQCAEMLNVDLEEMIDILRELEIPFNDDLEQQLETVNKLAAKISASSGLG